MNSIIKHPYLTTIIIEDVLDQQLNDLDVVEGSADSDQQALEQDEEEIDEDTLADMYPTSNAKDYSDKCKLTPNKHFS